MFFITSIKHPNDNDVTEFPVPTEAICWGYYPNREYTINFIADVTQDFHEGHYNWLVVENITEGIQPTPLESIWFQWDNNLNHWIHIVNPPAWSYKIKTWAFG